MRSTKALWFSGSFLALVILVHAVPSLARIPAQIPAGHFRWGTILQADEAYYPVGGTARVTSGVYNLTDQDIYLFFDNFGGNGCGYSTEILDSQGRVVWEYGFIIGGNFAPPLCPPPPAEPIVIPSNGGRTATTESIPLIYQNAGGIGTLGSALPAGHYEFRFRARATGPLRDGQTQAGLTPTATLPFQIEP